MHVDRVYVPVAGPEFLCMTLCLLFDQTTAEFANVCDSNYQVDCESYRVL
jgi:hypothetical protein